MKNTIKVDKTLDIKGLSAQRPAEVTKSILNLMMKGQTLRVVADDAAAKQNIPVLCENLGCIMLSMEEEGGRLYFTIRK
jgi:TusA-related sulfurtransferase